MPDPVRLAERDADFLTGRIQEAYERYDLAYDRMLAEREDIRRHIDGLEARRRVVIDNMNALKGAAQ